MAGVILFLNFFINFSFAPGELYQPSERKTPRSRSLSGVRIWRRRGKEEEEKEKEKKKKRKRLLLDATMSIRENHTVFDCLRHHGLPL